MRRKILFATLICSLLVAIGLADKGQFMIACLIAVYPFFVLILNLIDSIRRGGL